MSANSPAVYIPGSSFSRHPAFWLLVVFTLFFVILFTARAQFIHGIFGTSAYDLGIFDQAFWRYSQGLSNFNTIRGMNILGDHFSLISLLFAPLYRIWPDIGWALAMQSISVAAGGLMVFAISRHYLPGRIWVGVMFALAYLLHPAAHNTLLWQYHEIVLASGMYMALIWAYLKDRPRLFFVLLFLLVACREDMPFTLIAFGFVAMSEKRWRYGIPMVVISVFWWLLVTRLAMPWLNGVGYFRSGQGAQAVLFANLWNPGFYLAKLTHPQTVGYLWKIFLPVGLLGLISPRYLLPALPTLAANVLFGGYNTNLNFHYSVSIIPFFFWAAIAGSAKFSQVEFMGRFRAINFPVFAAVFSFAFCSWLYQNHSVFELRRFPRYYTEWKNQAGKREHVQQLARRFGGEGVSASDWMAPHFSHRENIYLFPNPWKNHYWGVNGENQHHPNKVRHVVLNRHTINEHKPVYDYLVDSGTFRKVSESYDLVVLERQKAEDGNLDQALAQVRNFSSLGTLAFRDIWLSQPYPTSITEFDRIDIRPETGKLPAKGNKLPDLPAGVGLDLVLGQSDEYNFSTRYVRTVVDSPAICQVRLEVGSDDGVTIWLNGSRVHQKIGLRGARPGEDVIDLQLKKGPNTLLFRVNNATGGFRLISDVRLTSCPEKAASWVQGGLGVIPEPGSGPS